MRLKYRVEKLESEVKVLQDTTTQIIPIATFAPENIEVLKWIPAVITNSDNGFVATFYDANVSSSGDTISEAMYNLKEALMDAFDYLMAESDSNLGEGLKITKSVLKRFMRRPIDKGPNVF